MEKTQQNQNALNNRYTVDCDRKKINIPVHIEQVSETVPVHDLPPPMLRIIVPTGLHAGIRHYNFHYTRTLEACFSRTSQWISGSPHEGRPPDSIIYHQY